MVFDIVKRDMEFPLIQDLFNVMVDNAEIAVSKEVAKCVLYGILTLFTRIRTFTLAKDIIQKQKINAQIKRKSGSFMKGIEEKKLMFNIFVR